MKTKTIEYAYPTSITAKKHGFYKSGCYVVELMEWGKYNETIKAFPTWRDALEFAKGLPNEWNALFWRIHGYYIENNIELTDR